MAAYLPISQASFLVSQFHNAYFGALAYWIGLTTGPWLILAVLVLLRLRWIAALVAVAALTLSMVYTAGAPNWSFMDPESMFLTAGLGLEIAVLIASAGPRRARVILNWKYYLLTVVAAVTASTVSNWLWLAHPVISDSIVIAVIVVGLAGLAATSPAGRRSAVLLSIPAYYLVVGLLVMPSMTGPDNESGWLGPLRFTLTGVPLALTACVAVAAAVRFSRQPHPRVPRPQ